MSVADHAQNDTESLMLLRSKSRPGQCDEDGAAARLPRPGFCKTLSALAMCEAQSTVTMPVLRACR
jgi:hypothetical protein